MDKRYGVIYVDADNEGMEIIVDTRKIAFIGIVLLLKRIRRESKSNEKVLFICSGGMSSAIVEKALDKEAEKKELL